MGVSVTELLIVAVIGVMSAILVIWPASRVCSKAGFSPWLGVMVVIPLANVCLLWFLAIAKWPDRLVSAANQQNSGGATYPGRLRT